MWPVVTTHRDRYEPRVPAELMIHVTGNADHDEFVRSGWEVASMLNLAAKKYTGRFIFEYGSTLDFGCGCGRIARFMPPTQKLWGCDVDRAVVEYCRTTYNHFDFHQSPLMPPLRFADETFDLVYSFSVFSHLRADVEEAWLAELRRVGKPGCIYLLTIHGDWFIEATLAGEEQAQAWRDGFYFRNVHGRRGVESDFPEYYEASYHTSDYVRREWSRHFDILAVIRGDSPSYYNSEGLTAPLTRPMGQDLVVARRR